MVLTLNKASLVHYISNTNDFKAFLDIWFFSKGDSDGREAPEIASSIILETIRGTACQRLLKHLQKFGKES